MINWDRPDDGRERLALFDLSNDIGEHRNLADKFPERVSEMKAAIKEWQHEVAVGATVQPQIEGNKESGEDVDRAVKRFGAGPVPP